MNGEPWSSADTATLRRLAGTMADNEIAKITGHSRTAVGRHRRLMRLPPSQKYTLNRELETPPQRMERLSIRAPNGCLLWTGPTDRDGYGAIYWQHDTHKTHRLAWEQANGPIPVGLLICHKCDVRNCIEPDHLFLGTHLSNMADKVRRGRLARQKGEAHGRAKLTDADVRAIRASSASRKDLAAQYSVSATVIYSVLHRFTWAHVT